ncbi:hypothetical protein COO60DRAFT_1228395 [Scenedesmus sp. NREL 46B-D3]|nr:hypothetical protein COO60DRAFT_1228395 [Scenedesmus sp. NREL 46B-D3]
MLAASLGALGLLAVDKQARQHLIASRQGLSLLADVAALPSAAFRRQQCEEQVVRQPEHSTRGQADVSGSASDAQLSPAAAAATAAAAAPVMAQSQQIISNATAGGASEAAAAQPPDTEHPANADTKNVSQDADGAAGAAASASVAEDPVAIPAVLLDMQPNQLAAEVLAAVLLRDAEARVTFMQGGNCRLLLSLLKAPDVGVQLCGVAAAACMASTPGRYGKCSQLAQQEPQLLRQLHSSILTLLETQLLQRVQPEQHTTAAAGSYAGGMDDIESSSRGNIVRSSCSVSGSCQLATGHAEQAVKAADSELQEMLLEYSCLALWVATAAVAPLLTKDEVLQQLASAGQLAHACMQLHDPTDTIRPTVVCCMSGVLCVLAATNALPEAAAESAIDGVAQGGESVAAALVQALQPAMLAVLQLEASAREVLQAKYLIAMTLMLLANCEHPMPANSNSSSDGSQGFEQPITSSRFGSAGGSSCAQSCSGSGLQQVNPHPPFRGVFEMLSIYMACCSRCLPSACTASRGGKQRNGQAAAVQTQVQDMGVPLKQDRQMTLVARSSREALSKRLLQHC